jgi:transposase InsO family protein
LVQQPGANVSALCQRYGISRKTGYKWRSRREDSGENRSRRPQQSPHRTTQSVESAVLAVRDQFPDWGARKLKRYLQDRGHAALPAVSTITAILQRHGRITPAASIAARPWQRFEHSLPNALWQMDFKGHFAMIQGRCHALTVLDDHSRFNLVLHAGDGETFENVQVPLERCFRRYGLPTRISCDNGPPWGNVQRHDGLTRLGAWLIRLGIGLTHARPSHPQTNGKDERFHRTLNSGLLRHRVLQHLADAQRAFDVFRQIYNHERPHEALNLDVPISRYRPSERTYPDRLPPIDYDPALPVRKVDVSGRIQFRGRRFNIAKALSGERVAIQSHPDRDGQHTVYFCHQPVRRIDLRYPESAD